VERMAFSDVRITPAEPIDAGAEFSLTLTYAGSPGQIRSGSVAPWMRAGEEWLVAGQPESSAWWFPANDHPSDPALLEVSVRVPAGMEALSTGHLQSTDTGQEPGFDTWHWVTRRPIPTYASFVSIGQYQLRRGTEDGRAFVYAVSEQLSATDREKAFAAMQTSAKTVRTLESMFGPYPPTTLGGIVPAHDLRFDGLETQGRPIYDRESIIDPRFSQVLVIHELAHMWFGNHVTLREWNDVFLNEAYASWAEWARAERSGGQSADEQLNGLYARAKDRPEFWRVTMDDPRPDNLFTTVYARGPMTLQALRNVIGDEAFLGLARRWAKQPGPRSVEEWMVMAQASTRVDLVDFFHAWMLAPSAPAQTRANGLRP
jgi:aminopeptidase N